MTYADTVLDHADQEGNLSHADASRLLREHGCSLIDLYEDDHGISAIHLDERNAEALLAWLGY